MRFKKTKRRVERKRGEERRGDYVPIEKVLNSILIVGWLRKYDVLENSKWVFD